MEIQRIGADIGFGGSKLAWFDEDGQFHTLVMASVYGLNAQIRNMDLGLGGPKRHRPFRFSYGKDYLMGADALLHSPLGITQSQTFERIGSNEERTLMLALLAKAELTDVAVVTGLPVLAWDRRHQLRRSWVGEHKVRLGRREMTINMREVRTSWQPVMSLWDVALAINEDGVPVLANGMTEELLRKGWLIIDCGHNTFDMAAVVNLTPVEQWSGGSFLGGKDLLGVLQQHIVDQHGVHRSLSELQQALRVGIIDIYDEEVDLLPLTQAAGSDLAAQAVSEVSGKIKDASRFYGIILTGGPAKVLQPAMARAFPRNRLYTLDQLGNARGAAKWALGPGVFKCLR